MWSLIKKRRMFKKPVDLNKTTMFQLCSEVRNCIFLWRRTLINTADIWLHLRAEFLRLADETNRYLRIVLQIQTAIISESEPNPVHYYVLLYQSIARQFLAVEFRTVGFQRKLDVIDSKEGKYLRKWVRPVLDDNYKFRRMPFRELKNLWLKLKKGKRIAVELYEEIRNLQEEMDGMKAQLDSDIRNCIRQAEDLLSRIQLGQGIWEE